MPRRILTGEVVSKKSDKTVSVRVEGNVRHPVYKKFVRRSKKYAVHNEIDCDEGDIVLIMETRPISKTKHWVTKEVVRKKVSDGGLQ